MWRFEYAFSRTEMLDDGVAHIGTRRLVAELYTIGVFDAIFTVSSRIKHRLFGGCRCPDRGFKKPFLASRFSMPNSDRKRSPNTLRPLPSVRENVLLLLKEYNQGASNYQTDFHPCRSSTLLTSMPKSRC